MCPIWMDANHAKTKGHMLVPTDRLSHSWDLFMYSVSIYIQYKSGLRIASVGPCLVLARDGAHCTVTCRTKLKGAQELRE